MCGLFCTMHLKINVLYPVCKKESTNLAMQSITSAKSLTTIANLEYEAEKMYYFCESFVIYGSNVFHQYKEFQLCLFIMVWYPLGKPRSLWVVFKRWLQLLADPKVFE